jgi:hypothetical protein
MMTKAVVTPLGGAKCQLDDTSRHDDSALSARSAQRKATPCNKLCKTEESKFFLVFVADMQQRLEITQRWPFSAP